MPSKRRRNHAGKEIAAEETVNQKPELSYYNLPGRLINWLENPENFRSFQNYLMLQSVACAFFYSWYQSQFAYLYE